MDLQQAMIDLNIWGVLLAALSAFMIGGVWYTALFGKRWMKLNGFTEEQLSGKAGLVFGGSFILALIIAFVLALFLGSESTPMLGATAGFMAGLFWVAAGMGITYLFERKSLELYLINAGYHVVTFTLMGLIIGFF